MKPLLLLVNCNSFTWQLIPFGFSRQHCPSFAYTASTQVDINLAGWLLDLLSPDFCCFPGFSPCVHPDFWRTAPICWTPRRPQSLALLETPGSGRPQRAQKVTKGFGKTARTGATDAARQGETMVKRPKKKRWFLVWGWRFVLKIDWKNLRANMDMKHWYVCKYSGFQQLKVLKVHLSSNKLLDETATVHTAAYPIHHSPVWYVNPRLAMPKGYLFLFLYSRVIPHLTRKRDKTTWSFQESHPGQMTSFSQPNSCSVLGSSTTTFL